MERSEEIEEICDICDQSSVSVEDGNQICLKSPVEHPCGKDSIEDQQDRENGIFEWYSETADLKKCPLGKW